MSGWIYLLDEPATAEVHHFGSKRVEQYRTLAEAIAEQHDASLKGWAHICNITAADGSVYKPDT